MKRLFALRWLPLALTISCNAVPPQAAQKALDAPVQPAIAKPVVDIETRPGVTQRFLYLAPAKPRGAVILFAGGHGGLQISPEGSLRWGDGNFLVRSRGLFVEQGLAVAVVDAPSDRQHPPYLAGFRQTPWHVADVKAVIGWLKRQGNWPVWLVGTSLGTYSAAYVATQPEPGGPDGIVLASTILVHVRFPPVPALPLDRIKVPVLVVHHEHDECPACAYAEMPRLLERLGSAGKRELVTIRGGSAKGDPCEAFGHHGYLGNEREAVEKITTFIMSN